MSKLPSRLHHTAYVTKDMEKTRAFYEDVLGLPLTATWCETDFLFGKDRTYCHCFFGIGDGGALAFFQFADKEDEALFVPDMPATPFVHLALKVDEETQKAMEERIKDGKLTESQARVRLRIFHWCAPIVTVVGIALLLTVMLAFTQ